MPHWIKRFPRLITGVRGKENRCIAVVLAILLLPAVALTTMRLWRAPKVWSQSLEYRASLSKLNTTDAKTVFDGRIKAYQALVPELAINLKLQGVFFTLAVFFIYKQRKTWDVKSIGVEIRATDFQLFLPLALFFLWLQFGYLLHTLIDMRITIWDLVPKIEQGTVGKEFSLRYLLRDQFFLDLWFLVNDDARSGIDEHSRTLNSAVFAGFGVFLGIMHAAIFAVICVRFEHIRDSTPANLRRSAIAFHCAFAAVISVLILGSHIQFMYGGPHENWLQFVILWTAPPAGWLILWLTSGDASARPAPPA